MCGIAGIFDTQGQRHVSETVIEPMVRALHHRGPDQKGIYLDDNIGLGQARLSLLDLAGGGQPIHNEDKTIWIVLNGEIYNYRELRKDLEIRGHRFYTTTDTEVIVHLYEEKGFSCLESLNGQFAFAVWDHPQQTLFLARDHFGICPLYYAEHNGRFLFASEIKSLIASRLLPPPSINPRALDQVFTFWSTLPGLTIFENIQELRPGQCLTINARQLRLHTYWDIPYHSPDAYCQDTPGQISEQILALLLDATQIRLRADVPVGSYLSGGLDSAGITSLIVRHFNPNVRTFGIRFQEHDYDEGRFQNEMAAHLQVQHHELTAKNALIAEAFPQVVWHCETPVLRTAPVPMFLLSRFVKQQGIKVVCTGEGADEVFGGYDIFREALVRRFVLRQPSSQSRSLLLERIYPHIFRTTREKKSFREFILHHTTDVQDPLFSHVIRWTNTTRIKQFFSKNLQSALHGYSAIHELVDTLPADFSRRDLLSKAQYLEDKIFLSNYLLSTQGDRMAMAHGVEIRPPYLDTRIIDFMSRVSPTWKILGLDEKHLLKKAFKNILPSAITQRTKQPYRAPIQKALIDPLKHGSFQHLLSPQRIEDVGLFDPAKVSNLLNKMRAGASAGETEGMAISGILSTQILVSQFIEDFPPIEPVKTKWDIYFNLQTYGRRSSRTERES
jgi:asparagine synthase (glutamine-hydrolysing)